MTAPTAPQPEISPEAAAKLAELRAPFPPEYIGKLPRVTCGACSQNKREKHCDRHQRRECPTCKNYITTAHMHLDYVGHAEITDRLLKSDPAWSWKPMHRDVDPQALAAAAASGNAEVVQMVLDSAPPRFDQHGGLWIWLTVHGVTRPGYGDAVGKQAGPMANKEVIGDAIRNAAMRFGLGLDLWSKSDMGEREAAAAAERDTQDRAAEQPRTAPPSGPFQLGSPPDAAVVDQLAASVAEADLDGLKALWDSLPARERAGEITGAGAGHIRRQIKNRKPELSPVDEQTLKRLHTVLTNRGVKASDDRLLVAARLADRPDIESTKDLTQAQAMTVIRAVDAAGPDVDLVTGETVPPGAGVDPAEYANGESA